MKLIQAEEKDFGRLTAFYRFVIDNTETMPVYCRWIYGLHPSDEMIEGYIRQGNMYYTERDGVLLSAVAVVPGQGEDYHGADWAVSLADDEVGTLHLFCVNPVYQRQGTARRTTEAVVGLLKAAGKKAVRLDALASNLPAHRLYESLGFVKRGTLQMYARNVGMTEFFLYEKLLLAE